MLYEKRCFIYSAPPSSAVMQEGPLSRSEAVRRLYEDTHLTPVSIVGTFQILDKAKCALLLENVLTAAWTAYKVYETYVSQTLTDFRAVAPIATQDLRGPELYLLASIQWTVPARSRTDAVDELLHALGVAGLDYGQAAVLSLVLPECSAMTDDQYARVVVCAAAQLARTKDMSWAAGLATPAVGADYIMKWGLRIASLAGPREASGTKRKREE